MSQKKSEVLSHKYNILEIKLNDNYLTQLMTDCSITKINTQVNVFVILHKLHTIFLLFLDENFLFFACALFVLIQFFIQYNSK